MRNFIKTIAGILWFAFVFYIVYLLFGVKSMYVSIAIWLVSLVVLYIYAVRAYGFKHAITMAMYLSGLKAEINEELRQDFINGKNQNHEN